MVENTVDEEIIEKGQSVSKKRATKNMANDVVKTGSSENIDERVTTTNKSVNKKKSFKNTDPISCRSIMTGKTFVRGIKTKNLYRFEFQGDVVEIEYQDLIASVRAKSDFLFKPTIIVLDKDFIEQNKAVSDFYTKFYTKDFNKIFNMSPKELEKTLKELPPGVQNAIKSMAATKIANGSLDSVQKIKVFDKVFNTKMMLLTGLYD